MTLLEKLEQEGDVEYATLVTRDGLLIASGSNGESEDSSFMRIPAGIPISSEINGENFAAMSATMLGAAETAISELKRGTVEGVTAEGEQTKLITTGAGPNAVLVTMVDKDANLGLIPVEMKRIAHMMEEGEEV